MKYGLFCPLKGLMTTSTSFSCTNLLIPYDKGLNYEGSFAGVSNKLGNVVSYAEVASASNHFSSNTLELVTKEISRTR